MKTRNMFLLLASCLLPLASLTAAEDYMVAKVGETEVYFSEIEEEAGRLNPQMRQAFEQNPQWRMQFIAQYVSGIAFGRRAEREGLDKDPGVKKKLEKDRRIILARTIVQKKLEALDVNEEAVRNYYQQNQGRYTNPVRMQVMYAHSDKKDSIEMIIEAVRKGEIFEKATGGKFVFVPGWVERNSPFIPGLTEILTTAQVDPLFDLSEQSAGGLIEGSDGRYYVFFVAKKEGSFVRPFEEVAAQAEEDYRQAMSAAVIQEFMRETFEQEKVDIFDEVIARNSQAPASEDEKKQ